MPESDQPGLFAGSRDRPLADRLRPRHLDEFVGQRHLLAPDRPLGRLIEQGRLVSALFWGPPGCGKTTLATLWAQRAGVTFLRRSAILSGAAEVKKIMADAARRLRLSGTPTALFLDEIHRFNKAQQDAFLPFVEAGDILLLGATTENPSFRLNPALMSRLRVFVLEPLSEEEVRTLLVRAMVDEERGLGRADVEVEEAALSWLARAVAGDARRALAALEVAAGVLPPGGRLTRELATRALGAGLPHDRQGDAHFDLLSALHKSVRASDVQAAIYWATRMLEAGEDPMILARRLIRIASEDVGLADPRGLQQALAARDAAHALGRPEGDLALLQATAYLALAPKSDALYRAHKAAMEDVRRLGALPVPLALRNAPTDLMKDLGHGRGYEHAHDLPAGLPAMTCLPAPLEGRTYYQPRPDRGFEMHLARRLAENEATRRARRRESDDDEGPR